ncbi:MAG: imidazole glycerol phosphate synthase subunit HisH, partial [Candidatus Omnitrophica bacterium]|nr:imidazole glycerol phosphate synthase subunit HisH [Candidatus Omnitrophota bacterium]
MIAVIDYGMGNLGSVSKALKSLGAEVKVTAACADLKKADKIVLPGVGAFKDTMDALARLGLSEALKDVILSKK